MKVFRFCFYCFFLRFLCVFFFIFAKSLLSSWSLHNGSFSSNLSFSAFFIRLSSLFLLAISFLLSLFLALFLITVFVFQQFFIHSQNQIHLVGFFLYCNWWWWWRCCLNHFKLFIVFWLTNLTFHSLNLMWNSFLRSMLRLSTKL